MADEKKPAKPQPKASPGGKPPQGAARPKGGGKGAPAAAPEAAPARRAAISGEIPPRLRERFRTAAIPALMKERGYDNPFQVPRLEKIVINMGLREG